MPADIPNVMRRAFSRLRNGRGGPVIVEIPSDIWNEEVPEPLDYRPVLSTRCGPDPKAVEEAVDVLLAAKRPVIYAGQGIHYARAWPQLRRWPSGWRSRCRTSLEGKSAFPEDHALALGSGGARHPQDRAALPGRGGPHLRRRLLSFTETSFGVQMPKRKRVIHATLDPDHVNKDYEAEVALIGDAALTLDAVLARARQAQGAAAGRGPPSPMRSPRCGRRGSRSGCRSSPPTRRR